MSLIAGHVLGAAVGSYPGAFREGEDRLMSTTVCSYRVRTTEVERRQARVVSRCQGRRDGTRARCGRRSGPREAQGTQVLARGVRPPAGPRDTRTALRSRDQGFPHQRYARDMSDHDPYPTPFDHDATRLVLKIQRPLSTGDGGTEVDLRVSEDAVPDLKHALQQNGLPAGDFRTVLEGACGCNCCPGAPCGSGRSTPNS